MMASAFSIYNTAVRIASRRRGSRLTSPLLGEEAVEKRRRGSQRKAKTGEEAEFTSGK